MRTSHLEIRRRIEDEKKKIFDQELFASKAFEAYLGDLAETASKRYKRKIKVKTFWNVHDRNIAATDNRNIVMNTANSIAMSFPTRRLKADCLIGMLAHEIGHVLFTNFAIMEMYRESLINGNFFPSEPEPMSVIESVNLDEIKEYLAKGERIPMEVILMAAHSIHNILEDIYIEARMCNDFPGRFKTGIQLVNLRIPEFCPSIVEQIDNEVKGFSILSNGVLKELSADERTILLYEAREKARMDNESRMAGALKQGAEQKAVQIIKKLHAMNMSLEDIAEATELPVDKVRAVLDSQNK